MQFKKVLQRIILIILAVVGVIALAVAAVFGYLTVTEYNPADIEELEISGTASNTLQAGADLRVMTWNIGYGALGDNADFFMDGGSSVYTADEARVQENMAAILAEVEELQPDIALFQESDEDADRSRHVNEADMLRHLEGYEGSFAYNFKVNFIPYPIPPIGKVYGGLTTLSRYEITSAQRISLPVSFKWPIRTGNLKRCLSVNTIPVENSEHNLLVVNLHLEAYDDGDGKRAQTEQLNALLSEAAENGDYVIAGGDFNQVFSDVDTSAYPTLEGMWQPGVINVEDFSDELSFHTDASTPTCRSLDRVLADAADTDPQSFQYYMIDGFIVSSNIQVNAVETQDLGFVNSDHNPVAMDITLTK